jgi:mRNA-degrading endonuclease RelE of RelBE toxin-antitoxin system
MNCKVVVADTFKREAKRLNKKHGSLKADIAKLIESLESEPIQGIPLGRDCYKIRMAISSKGKGKSGGARVITCVKVVKETVYLLAIFDKSEKSSLDDSELDFLLEEAGFL